MKKTVKAKSKKKVSKPKVIRHNAPLGEVTAWKKILVSENSNGTKKYGIVELLISKTAHIIKPSFRHNGHDKARCSEAKVISISDNKVNYFAGIAERSKGMFGVSDKPFTYIVGATVKPKRAFDKA